jgi:hypothetical protein
MLTSGVATRKTVDLDFEDESESTVHVMVHDIKPPFLDGRTVFTRQLDPINPIRDMSSDMAVFSKKGSALVKEKREQAERAKAVAKLAGFHPFSSDLDIHSFLFSFTILSRSREEGTNVEGGKRGLQG